MALVRYTLHPDDDNPTWGYAHHQSGNTDDSHEGRFTMRTDAERIRAAKEAHDAGAEVVLSGGVWQQRPGWPADWEDGTADDDALWSDDVTWRWSNEDDVPEGSS